MTRQALKKLERDVVRAAMDWYEVHAAAEVGYALRPKGELEPSRYDLLEVKLARACAAQREVRGEDD